MPRTPGEIFALLDGMVGEPMVDRLIQRRQAPEKAVGMLRGLFEISIQSRDKRGNA